MILILTEYPNIIAMSEIKLSLINTFFKKIFILDTTFFHTRFWIVLALTDPLFSISVFIFCLLKESNIFECSIIQFKKVKNKNSL